MADVTFRVHFEDGAKLDIAAPDAKAAGEIAGSSKPDKITKIKRVKEGSFHG